MCIKEKLVPGGILEPVSGRSFLFFGTHCKTSDFIADGLLLWWQHAHTLRKTALIRAATAFVTLDYTSGLFCAG